MLKIAALVVASAAGALATAAPPHSSPSASTSPKPSARTVSTATSSSDASSTLVSNAPWWEKVTVTLGDDGKPEACRYQTSLKAAAEECDVASSQAALATKASDNKGEVTQITFERRFDPGQAPTKPNLQTGDMLLGGEMMALAIDPRGSVKDCRVVAQSGAMRPDYSCDDASAERFQASYGASKDAPEREGYMTILVYGHSEHMV